MLSLHIESINSMINGEVATVHLCSFAECMYRLGNTMLAMCTISRYYHNKPLGLRILCSKNHQVCYAFILKHCGNYAAILTNCASFLHQIYFTNSPKDIYCRSQNMNNQKHWYTPYSSLSTNIWRQCPQYIQDAS